jgi:hypothetical protein
MGFDWAVIALLNLGFVALGFFVAYLVIRRAVRDGIWDAKRLDPDYPRPGIDMQRRSSGAGPLPPTPPQE